MTPDRDVLLRQCARTGCENVLPEKKPGTPGRPPKWCSENCRKRAFDHAKETSEAGRGRCVNPVCGALRGRAAAMRRPADRPRAVANGRTYALGYCASCTEAIAAVRRSLGEGVWADGWSVIEFREVIGMVPQVGRSRGWDIPHRYSTKRVAVMQEARWAA